MTVAAPRPLLVFIGVATEDVITMVDRYPAANERVTTEHIEVGGGGPAATAAVAAARLGMRTALIAAVGDDDAGRRILSELDDEGVDISAMQVVPGARSGRSVVVISQAEKTRAISNQAGPVLQLEGNDRARELISSASWVHVDQHGWGETRRHTDRLRQRPRLSVDAGNSIPAYRPDRTALYVPTAEALAERYQSDERPNDIEALLRRAVADGAETAVSTNGADGSFAVRGSDALIHCPAPSVEIVSTLGAGDVFHGALLAGVTLLERGALAGGFRAALGYATTVASLSCRAVNGRSGIPGHEEAMSIFGSLPKS